VGDSKKPGRRWAGPKGPIVEINAVAELLHRYMEQADLTLKDVHDAIVSDMLPLDTAKPSQRKMYDLLDGKGLNAVIADAVIDVCSGPAGDAELDEARRREVGALFLRAEQNPTPVRPDAPLFMELVAAKNQIIQVHSELNEARQALQKSTEARSQAENIASGLRLMLDRQHRTIRQLTKDRDRLHAQLKDRPALEATLTEVQHRMDQLRDSEERTQSTLRQAEQDRDDARATAAEAQRVIDELNDEIDRLRVSSPGADTAPAAAAIALPAAPFDFAGYDADLEESEVALSTAQALLEHGREAVEEAGRSIGYEREPDPGVIVGQVVPTPRTPGEAFSGTTPDNASTSEDTADPDDPADEWWVVSPDLNASPGASRTSPGEHAGTGYGPGSTATGTRPADQKPPTPQPGPDGDVKLLFMLDNARTARDMGAALRYLKDRNEETAAWSTAQLADRVFPRSTASEWKRVRRWLGGHGTPESRTVLAALVTALGAHPSERQAFLRAYKRTRTTRGETYDLEWGRQLIDFLVSGAALLFIALDTAGATAAVKADPGPATWLLTLYIGVSIPVIAVLCFFALLSDKVTTGRVLAGPLAAALGTGLTMQLWDAPGLWFAGIFGMA
jgi:hypothetical protein